MAGPPTAAGLLKGGPTGGLRGPAALGGPTGPRPGGRAGKLPGGPPGGLKATEDPKL